MENFNERAGEVVQRTRRERGMSQRELANEMTRLGHPMHQQTVLKIEKGLRALRFDEALALMDALGITTDDFAEPTPVEEWLDDAERALGDSESALRVALRDYHSQWMVTQWAFKAAADAGVDIASMGFSTTVLDDPDDFARDVLRSVRVVEDDYRRSYAAASEVELDALLAAQRTRQQELERLLEEDRARRGGRGQHPEA